jgi:hypothetical protein
MANAGKENLSGNHEGRKGNEMEKNETWIMKRQEERKTRRRRELASQARHEMGAQMELFACAKRGAQMSMGLNSHR